jgi:colanic acid/amylovoran biosynthesis glycosyltransferase
VNLLGSLNNEDVMKYMEACDIFILASEIYLNGKRDGIPTVCIEAMSVGKPVISTYISGIPELIENGETGLLVPERNPKALSSAIARLIDNPKFRNEIGINGYEYVKNNYNIEKTIPLLKKVFNQMIYEKE